MKDCTKRGDIVLDTFSGSGTTILAAERVGRRAYALEIDRDLSMSRSVAGKSSRARTPCISERTDISKRSKGACVSSPSNCARRPNSQRSDND